MAEQRAYATPADYFEFASLGMSDPSVEEDRRVGGLIRRASSSIDILTLTAHYATDDAGYPLDADVADAFRDATCAQVAFIEDSGRLTGGEQDYASGSLLSASFTVKETDSAKAGGRKSRYSPEAIDILRKNGLYNGTIGHR